MKKYQNYIQFKNWSIFFSYNEQENMFYKEIFRNIHLQNKKFLDFGFGAGSLLKWAYENRANVYGVEVQKKLINILNTRRNKLPLKLFSKIDDIKEVKFDIVTIFNVLEHLELKEIKIVVNKVYACMSDSGTLIITIPNCQSPAGLINQFGDPTHKSMLSGPIIEAILLEQGFKEVIYKSKPIQDSVSLTNRLIKKITMPIQMLFIIIYKITFSIGKTPLAPDVIIYASKHTNK
jgi:2-polyprenyl-3-methyl-5-hydroxy-6-metoxy-1,4-benzoquinol methylase